MTNYFSDNEDLQFYMKQGINWGPLVELVENGFRDKAQDGFSSTQDAVETYEEILKLIGEFVAEKIAPHTEALDREGVHYKDGEVSFPKTLAGVFDGLKELQLYGMTVPRELGGMNIPILVQHLLTEIIARADVSVMGHYSFHSGIAMCLFMYSILEGSTEFDHEGRIVKTRFPEELAEVLSGDAFGCMDITESHAGSDMAKLNTKAEQDENGQWLLTGEKIFITSGHGKYHFVIARSEKAKTSDDLYSGLDGLSMFMAKAYDDDADGQRTRYIQVTRVEEKCGHHASATCSLSFDKTPAHLIGKRGDGFKMMLMLMNGARLGVGFEALGMCESAVQLAEDYAQERQSMGKAIAQHEMIADYLMEMKSDIKGLRAMMVEAGFADEIAQRSRVALQYTDPNSPHYTELKRQRKKHQAIARRLTPLLKYFGAEKAVEMARRALQIHGGFGYTKEYGAEKLMRDALVLPIYEGTSQIQALMAMKDVVTGVLRDPQHFVAKLAQARWRSVSARCPNERRLAKLQSLEYAAIQHLVTKTAAVKLRSSNLSEWPKLLKKEWDPKKDFAWASLHAERLIRILIDVAICEILFKQTKEYPEREDIFLTYLERAEPRCRYMLDEIQNTGKRLVDSLKVKERESPRSKAM